MVEMALTFPLILMMFVGIYTFSLTLYQKFELTEGVSVAGRYLATDRGDNDPCSSAASKLYSAAPGLTKSSVTFKFTLNGVATNGASCPGTSGTPNSNMVSGQNATIHADYPCTFAFFPAWGATFTTQCSLHSGITEVIQ